MRAEYSRNLKEHLMDVDPDEVVTLRLRWDNGEEWVDYRRDLTRRQIGNLLLQVDDMADDTAIAQEGTA